MICCDSWPPSIEGACTLPRETERQRVGGYGMLLLLAMSNVSRYDDQQCTIDDTRIHFSSSSIDSAKGKQDALERQSRVPKEAERRRKQMHSAMGRWSELC